MFAYLVFPPTCCPCAEATGDQVTSPPPPSTGKPRLPAPHPLDKHSFLSSQTGDWNWKDCLSETIQSVHSIQSKSFNHLVPEA